MMFHENISIPNSAKNDLVLFVVAMDIGTKTARRSWKHISFPFLPLRRATELRPKLTTASQVRRLEAALRKAKPGPGDRYQRLAQMHRQSVSLCATLATRLRLTPSSKLDKRTPTDGELPVA